MISETLKAFKEKLSNQSSPEITILAGHEIGKKLIKLGYKQDGISQYYTK